MVLLFVVLIEKSCQNFAVHVLHPVQTNWDIWCFGKNYVCKNLSGKFCLDKKTTMIESYARRALSWDIYYGVKQLYREVWALKTTWQATGLRIPCTLFESDRFAYKKTPMTRRQLWIPKWKKTLDIGLQYLENLTTLCSNLMNCLTQMAKKNSSSNFTCQPALVTPVSMQTSNRVRQ